MVEDIQQEAYANQIARVVEDFLQLQMKFKAMLPKELSELQNRLDEIHPGGETHRAVNYDLFYRISHNLYRKNNLTMGELSSALSVPLSTATGMVDWLVNDGYAQRLPDPEDRRIVRVALTDSGRELHKMVEGFVGQRFQQILSYLTVEEQSMLFTLFRKVASALKEITG